MRRACFLAVLGLGGCAGSQADPSSSRDPDVALRESERAAAAREPTSASETPSSETAAGAAPTVPAAEGTETEQPPADDTRFQLSSGEFSGLVAGVPLWMDIATTAKGCNGPRSEFLLVDQNGKPIRGSEAQPGAMLVCMNPPVDPFMAHNVTQGVVLTLCDSPMGLVGCDANPLFEKDDYAAASDLLEQLSAKYGAGSAGQVPFSCSSPTERDRQFKRIWYVPLNLDNGDRFIYRIVLGWTCEPATGPRAPGILLVYQTPTEIERRFEDARERQESF